MINRVLVSLLIWVGVFSVVGLVRARNGIDSLRVEVGQQAGKLQIDTINKPSGDLTTTSLEKSDSLANESLKRSRAIGYQKGEVRALSVTIQNFNNDLIRSDN